METWTITEARAALPTIVNRVAHGEDVALTRHGKVVAVVVSPERVKMQRMLRVQVEANALRAEINAARHEPLVAAPGDRAWAQQMVDELRADRDAT